MGTKKVTITIYGAEQICASCVGAPGSKDTYEWLQAAIGRKYIDDPIAYEYIDINQPQEEEKHQQFVKRIMEEDLFYPIVFVNDEMVAEGIPRLKTIYQSLDKYGIQLQAYRIQE
ncbi:YuzD family protein [Oceanobacillus rekensis]|uniref:YuzD family protein n=1 Tax=Oceanobacillus rekensis TaxID=937927 RepID=UPI000B432B38|nr:YuzD family protein [Oceanobacillus rekensis]